MTVPLTHRRQTIQLFAALLGVLLQCAAPGQTPTRELLNSERITREFGNYGIEVLESSAEVRVSNLYSSESGKRTCRTFAVVRYPTRIAPAFAMEHAAIVNGGSIGAVLAAAGWEVRKTHLYFGETVASAKVAALMNVEPGEPLAAHVYVLDIAKSNTVFEYAALVEIHHPDYLRPAELPQVYGAATARGREDLVAAMLATAADRSR